ncbi:uncharacterized protein NECHADRAFT_79835 [Fusarium vanettenii 77-13-4]|uniref:F-box domain-containing protein n=1 Tax=Fusarium vanettenii (strain ATCC MYA-4622 / CBS 123669 / FGSC 9596 / NRRL 45880 / 77-13-4) TaxID=660122 RepID=C7Z0B8_FUSV7|nr:uncharacterized protein NECHADRAFT_79835 [Fusarium vanettenii 77-13-4]EEU42177.1 hypothetical protein NECHADRAFT_79835 [Fusarium vanettenii 77-13-4]
MASLLDLPDETLESVLLCNIDGRTLHQLTRVNKRLHRIASPILVQCWPYSHERLLLHLLHHPELRKHVKELKFESLVAFRDHEEDHSGCEISDESLEVLAATVDDAWPALAKSTKWAEYIRKGNTDALCTLLLCWATKLSSLDITIPYFDAKQRRDLLVLRLASQVVRTWKKTGSTGLPLLGLRSVVFRHWDTEFSTDGLYAAAFFHLPNVKSFSSWKFGLWGWGEGSERNYNDPTLGWVPTANPRDEYILDFPVGTSPIEELILDEVDVSVESLSRVVSACQRLKLLLYRPGPVCDNSWLSWRGLANVMLHHKNSLETLLIDFERPGNSILFSDDEEMEHDGSDDANDDGDNYGHDDDPEVGSIHLRDCYQYLECLKSLSIDVSFLYKEDDYGDYHITPSRLPNSLVNLRLEGLCLTSLWKRSIQETEDQVNDLASLVQECNLDGKLPNLRQINIAERLPQDLVLEAFDRLMELAKARGVKLTFIKRWEEPWEEIDWY